MPKNDHKNVPKHVAIIMDGNGRWAKGAEAVKVITRVSKEIGVSYLTLYAFSEENWKRPKYEVAALMSLLKRFMKSELPDMMENGIRFQVIGRIHKLSASVRKTIDETIEKTSKNKNTVLTLALSYGGRQEILDAVRKISMPDPDLLIRTSGESRISNFLLWQIAYSEIYLAPALWPDFREKEYLQAIEEYQNRERRFGATSGQLKKKTD
ncbi:MAG: di-trans,poly-cis-decaprenylcistransferase [Deltaproteobacteria bacterium]|nr:di-trans,poly-cis-decaprenylcistransferase [Deltaproteobacteria bacterium]